MKIKGASKRLLQLTVVTLFVSVMIGCSPIRKVLNTGDQWLIYDYAVELYNQDEWRQASNLFDAVDPYFTGTMKEDSLLFYRARCEFKMNKFESASILLDDFRRQFGRSPFLQDAEGMYSLSYYYMSPSVMRDQATTRKAIITISEFLSRYPDSEQSDTFMELQKELILRLHEKSYLNAYTYYKIGKYKSAIMAFKNAMKEYPESEYREQISYYSVLSAYELAHNSILSKKEDRYLAMIDAYFSFVAEFPESEYANEVKKLELRARDYIAKQSQIRSEGGVADDELMEKMGRKAAREREKEERAERKRLKREDKAESKKESEIESENSTK